MKITKLLIYVAILGCLATTILCVGSLGTMKMNTHFASLKKQNGQSPVIKEDRSKYAPKNLTADDLPDVPIYYQGWVKYFHFMKTSEKDKKKPQYFFKNEAYKKQVAEDANVEPKDDDKKVDDQVRYLLFLF